MLRMIIGLLVGLLPVMAWAADTPPDQLAKNTTQEVLAILKADKEIQGGNLKKVYNLVEAKVLPHFDFNRMTQLAVGRYWNVASATQKQSLVKEFRALLVRTYASSLTAFSNQTVEFKPFSMKPEATEVTVQTEVKQPGGKPIPINYDMHKTPFGWKVYDVSIDGVSLVINYRSSFANTIRQSGIDGLISMMEAKSRSLEKAPPQPAGGNSGAAAGKTSRSEAAGPAEVLPGRA
ncbi:MAG: ABC transporter substrate-binding protein [Pseudomonadota bacterium]